jgi:uncharacterized protein YbbC (DUF1343 family)
MELNSQIKLGIDVLKEMDFSPVRDQKVALLSNFAGRDNQGELSAKILAKSNYLNLDAILAPEHGFYTTVPAGLVVKDDMLFGVPVKSLYGDKKEPNTKYISQLDAVIIDLQDIGVRSYTYLSTMYNTMYVCALSNTKVIILDRPNPLGGIIVDGNVLDTAFRSFIGMLPIPYIHGCTFGELAYMINEESMLPKHNGEQLKCDLSIVTMQGWKRWMQWEDTKLAWFPTSPHIPSVNSIRGIAMLGAFGELGIMSIGIGTTLPFQYLGSTSFSKNFIDSLTNEIDFAGVQLNPIIYRPFYGMHSGKDINGYLLKFDIDNSFMPYSAGMELMFNIKNSYPKLFEPDSLKSRSIEMFNKATGTDEVFNSFFYQNDLNILRSSISDGVLDYIRFREKYLLY